MLMMSRPSKLNVNLFSSSNLLVINSAAHLLPSRSPFDYKYSPCCNNFFSLESNTFVATALKTCTTKKPLMKKKFKNNLK